jgi:alkylhydroperoxidase family enzyme
MARVPYVPVSEIDPRHEDLLGRPINLGQALVNSSDGYENHHLLGKWIREGSTISPRLRELLILQVGYTTGSRYEFSHHVKISRAYGVRDDDIRSLIAFARGEPNELTDLERAALRAASQLTETLQISDVVWAELAASFDASQLVEIVLIISYYNHVARILGALEIEVEPEYEQYLRAFPMNTDVADSQRKGLIS